MGFVTGFTGGVTLTLSLAYLSVAAHQRNREEQCRALRAQALALQSIVSPVPLPLPPSRSEAAAAQRAASVEVAKDRWNDEVERAARWVQNTDWVGMREGLEARLGALWASAFGDGAQDRANDKLESLAGAARSAAAETGGSISAAAKGALDRARDKTEQVGATAEAKAQEAKAAGRRAMARAGSEAREKAGETQGVLVSALEKSKDTAQGVVGRVKSAVGMGEGAAAAGLDECLALLKHTIFVPPIGDEPHRQAMRDAMARGRQKSGVRDGEETDGKADGQETDGRDVNGNGSPATAPVFETGMYGTQRQTVLLVDWHGNVTFIERALWDSNGHVIPRGDGDVVFRFHIDEWDD
ncbi:hypothetical protein CDD83_6623 [Cordyceps sp. RAO-2017]|nr:hypothetical protein CDD83_6623 [Cordyceps sp. RAO-2017]